MRKLLHFSLCAMLLFFANMAVAQEVTFDFTSNGWGLPEGSANKATDSQEFTNDTYTIALAATDGYYFNAQGYLMLGKSGSTLTLPAFDFEVGKIEVVGTSGASAAVKQNIYVGENAVSEETTGAKDVANAYEIAAEFQAAGTVYVLKVISKHNTQISAIRVYKVGVTEPPVVEPPVVPTLDDATVAAYRAADDKTIVTFGTDLTMLVQKAANYYLIDKGNNGVLLYDKNLGEVAPLSIVKAGLKGTKTTYNNAPELTSVVEGTFVTDGVADIEAIAGRKLAISEVTSDIVYDFVQVSGEITAVDGKNYTLTNGEESIVVYDNFGIITEEGELAVGTKATVEGIVTVYKGNAQLYLVGYEETVNPPVGEGDVIPSLAALKDINVDVDDEAGLDVVVKVNGAVATFVYEYGDVYMEENGAGVQMAFPYDMPVEGLETGKAYTGTIYGTLVNYGGGPILNISAMECEAVDADVAEGLQVASIDELKNLANANRLVTVKNTEQTPILVDGWDAYIGEDVLIQQRYSFDELPDAIEKVTGILVAIDNGGIGGIEGATTGAPQYVFAVVPRTAADIVGAPIVSTEVATIAEMKAAGYSTHVKLALKDTKITVMKQGWGTTIMIEDATGAVQLDDQYIDLFPETLTKAGLALNGYLNGKFVNEYGAIMLKKNAEAANSEFTATEAVVEPTVMTAKEAIAEENLMRYVKLENVQMEFNQEVYEINVKQGDVTFVVNDRFETMEYDEEFNMVIYDNLKSIEGIIIRAEDGRYLLWPLAMEAAEAVEQPLYTAVGKTYEDIDWGTAHLVSKALNVEAYNSYVIVRAFDGVEGYDLKVAFDEEENVTDIIVLHDGTETDATAAWANSGKVNWFAYKDEGYAYATSDAETKSGYVQFCAYVGSADNYVYYYAAWGAYATEAARVSANQKAALADMDLLEQLLTEWSAAIRGNEEYMSEAAVKFSEWLGGDELPIAIDAALSAVAEEGTYKSPLNEKEIRAQMQKYIEEMKAAAESDRQQMNLDAALADMTRVEQLQADWADFINGKDEYMTDAEKEFSQWLLSVELALQIREAYVAVASEGLYESPIDFEQLEAEIAKHKAAILKAEEEAIATAISNPAVQADAKAQRYNLNGQKVNANTKGLIIKNGRKVYVK